jgi:hypothetical protein
MSRRRGGIAARVSYTEMLSAPAWLLGSMFVADMVPSEWVLAAALSFVAWLYVRRR